MCDIALDAYVNARDFIMFDRRVASTMKSDILASTLYAQLAADKKIPRVSDYSCWRQTYLDAMTTFGWQLRTSKAYSHTPDSSAAFDVWTLINDVFAETKVIGLPDTARDYVALASPLLARISPCECTASTSGQQSIAVFSGQFQVSFVSAESILHSVMVSFNTTQPLDDDPLLMSLDPMLIVGAIDVMFFSAELLDIHYEMYRDAFESALAERKKTLTARVGEEP